MFDIGFSELVVCIVVALVVIGPERLPETVRTVGLWIGRLKRSLRETRSEIERQIGADDIRRQLHNEEIMRSLELTRREMEHTIQQATLNTDTYPERDEARIQPRIYVHEELPDHAHKDETPAVAALEQPDHSDKANNKTP